MGIIGGSQYLVEFAQTKPITELDSAAVPVESLLGCDAKAICKMTLYSGTYSQREKLAIRFNLDISAKQGALPYLFPVMYGVGFDLGVCVV